MELSISIDEGIWRECDLSAVLDYGFACDENVEFTIGGVMDS